VHTQGTIWNINSFDQWGVELGKELAQDITLQLENAENTKLDFDSSTAGLIRQYRALKKEAPQCTPLQ